MIFGWPIRSKTATVSGGSWMSNLPAANLLSGDLSLKARSSDALAASTKFDIDLGAAYPIYVLGLIGHNLSRTGATVRWYGDLNDPTFASPDYDSGAVNPYPNIYPASAALWGEDVSSGPLPATMYALGQRLDYFVPFTTANSYRYWRCEIVDTGNADGYVEVAMAPVAQGWIPSVRPSVGLKVGREDAKARRRLTALDMGLFDLDESLINVAELERALGHSGGSEQLDDGALVHAVGATEQFVWVEDEADTTHLARRSYLATLAEFDPLVFPFAGNWGRKPVTIREEIVP